MASLDGRSSRKLFEKREDDVACGEIETGLHPGYLGSQDTFLLVISKGLGRFTSQDLCGYFTAIAFAKLYQQNQTAPYGEIILNDSSYCLFLNAMTCYASHLTDRGTRILRAE